MAEVCREAFEAAPPEQGPEEGQEYCAKLQKVPETLRWPGLSLENGSNVPLRAPCFQAEHPQWCQVPLALQRYFNSSVRE